MAKLAEVEGHSGQDYAEKHRDAFAALKQRILELEASLKDANALGDSQMTRLKELEAEHSSRGVEKDRLEGIIAHMEADNCHKLESLQKELNVTLAKLKVCALVLLSSSWNICSFAFFSVIHPLTFLLIHSFILSFNLLAINSYIYSFTLQS